MKRVFLVSAPFLWRDYKYQSNLHSKEFNWGLAFSSREWVHDQQGRNHGSRQVGRFGAGEIAESSHLICKFQAVGVGEEDSVTLGLAWTFKDSSPPKWHTSSKKATPILIRPQFLILPKEFNWKPNTQIYEPIAAILTQTAIKNIIYIL